MKILTVSHFYPPIRSGGYAQLTAEVCDKLKARGHQIEILTSRFDVHTTTKEPHVHRLLYLENDLNYYSPRRFLTQWLLEEMENDKVVKDLVGIIRPDVAFIWGMYGISHSVPAALERLLPNRVIYYISDHWPINPSFHEKYWRSTPNSILGHMIKPIGARSAQSLLKMRGYPPKLDFEHTIIVSDAVRRNLLSDGVPIQDSTVIHAGTDASEYLFQRDYNRLLDENDPIKLLYAGTIGHHKGVHTIIEALALLHDELQQGKLTLSIYGSGHPDYEHFLRQQIASNHLERWISMPGKIPGKKIPGALLQEHAVLIIPSICEDALPRIVQEAMLSGMVVIGSERGGIPEMLSHSETGLLFESGNAQTLANQILKVMTDRQLAVRLAQAGQEKALKNFSLELMVDRIEAYLKSRFLNGKPIIL